MKKILWVLLLAMCVGSLYAANDTATGRRAEMLLRYTPKNTVIKNSVTAKSAEVAVKKIITAEDFLKAVRGGKIDEILQVKDKTFLTAQDKFENNIFHLAPNASTVQALAGLVRNLMGEEEFLPMLKALRDQRNKSGETPLMYHVNFGIADTFDLLYKGSTLAADIHQVRLVDKGQALDNTAWAFKGTAIAHSKDNSGRTVAQAALANCQMGNAAMCHIAERFQATAPYLF